MLPRIREPRQSRLILTLPFPPASGHTQCNSTPFWEEGSQSPGFLDSEALRSAVAMAESLRDGSP